MDFFDELTAVIARDGAKRGIRCSASVWQQFLSAVVEVEHQLPQAAANNIAAAENWPAEPTAETPTAEITDEYATAGNAGASLPQDWPGLQQVVANCCNCPLGRSRTNVVFGEGNIKARLMFVGEGPGAEEDATGRPFVGPAGQLLDKMIAAMHLSRDEVYIANIVKCRPPGNRMPGEEEAAACIGYLKKQIELIQPEVIVLLGGTALHFLLQIDGITKYRGRWQSYNNIAVMPTFHPAFLLRKAEAKREAWHDLKLVMAKLGIAV